MINSLRAGFSTPKLTHNTSHWCSGLSLVPLSLRVVQSLCKHLCFSYSAWHRRIKPAQLSKYPDIQGAYSTHSIRSPWQEYKYSHINIKTPLSFPYDWEQTAIIDAVDTGVSSDLSLEPARDLCVKATFSVLDSAWDPHITSCFLHVL